MNNIDREYEEYETLGKILLPIIMLAGVVFLAYCIDSCSSWSSWYRPRYPTKTESVQKPTREGINQRDSSNASIDSLLYKDTLKPFFYWRRKIK